MIITDNTATTQDGINAEVLLSIENVNCFQIIPKSDRAPEGRKTLVTKGTMKVLSVSEEGQDVVFFRIGDINVPLFPDAPALKVSKLVYILPMPGDIYIGLEFPEDTDEEMLEVFSVLAQDATSLHDADADSANIIEAQLVEEVFTPGVAGSSTPIADKVAGSIVSGSGKISTGLVEGASKIGSAMKSGGEWIKGKTATREGEPYHVSETTRATIRKVRGVTGIIVKVSAGLVKGVLNMSAVLAQQLSDGFSQTEMGKKIAENPSSNMQAAKKITVSTIYAADRIMDGLENAAKVLMADASTATSAVVEHKLGEEAGNASRDLLGCVTDVAETGINLRKMGAKALVAGTGGRMTAQVLSDQAPPQASIDPSFIMATTMIAGMADSGAPAPPIASLPEDKDKLE